MWYMIKIINFVLFVGKTTLLSQLLLICRQQIHYKKNSTLVNGGKKESLNQSAFFVIHDYNTYMGGTGRQDQNINCYRMSIRMKKWWWPILSWMIDVAIQNTWLLHRFDDKKMSLLSFHQYTDQTYLQQAEPRRTSGRPRVFASKVIPDERYDNIGYYVTPLGKQSWKCAVSACKSRPSQGCVTCGVSLCIICFIPFHTK